MQGQWFLFWLVYFLVDVLTNSAHYQVLAL